MKRWFEAVHENGAVEYPVSTSDGPPDGYGSGWTLTPLDREPGEHDDVLPGGKVRPNAARKAASDRRQRALKPDEMTDELAALKARLAALERTQQEKSK